MFLIRKIGLISEIQNNKSQLKQIHGLGKNFGTYQQEKSIYSGRDQNRLKTEEDQTRSKVLSTREVKSMQLGEVTELNLEQDTNIIFEEEYILTLTDT